LLKKIQLAMVCILSMTRTPLPGMLGEERVTEGLSLLFCMKPS
jgi:hypothetical protein